MLFFKTQMPASLWPEHLRGFFATLSIKRGKKKKEKQSKTKEAKKKTTTITIPSLYISVPHYKTEKKRKKRKKIETEKGNKNPFQTLSFLV